MYLITLIFHYIREETSGAFQISDHKLHMLTHTLCILTYIVLGLIHPVIIIFIHSMWSVGVSMEAVLAAEQFTGLL